MALKGLVRRKTVAEIVSYPMKVAGADQGKPIRERVMELLEMVGLTSANIVKKAVVLAGLAVADPLP